MGALARSVHVDVSPWKGSLVRTISQVIADTVAYIGCSVSLTSFVSCSLLKGRFWRRFGTRLLAPQLLLVGPSVSPSGRFLELLSDIRLPEDSPPSSIKRPVFSRFSDIHLKKGRSAASEDARALVGPTRPIRESTAEVTPGTVRWQPAAALCRGLF